MVRCSGISAARHFAAAALISTTALAMAQSGGQPAKPGVGQSTDASPELKSLVGAAVALPVEYQSDILIDLIEKGKVSDPRWKGQLLEDLFHHACEAKNPYPEVDSGESNDTVSARQGFAFLSGLDSLSIQCRVVRLVLNGSGRKARELFTQIVHPSLPPIPCSEPMTYDVHVYFDTLREVFLRSFTAPERGRGDDVQLLLQTIGSIQSAEELAPAGNLIAGLSLKLADQAALASLFESRLASVSTGDREFHNIEAKLGLAKAVQSLAECELRNQRDPDGLLRAYRKFLVRQLAGPRCADSLATPQAAGGVRKGADPREFFNETLAPLSPDRSLMILAQDATPSRVLESAKFLPLKFPDLSAVINELDDIRNRPDGQAHEHGDWEQPVSDILRGLQESSDSLSDNCPKCVFHEKALAYVILVDLLPPSPLYDDVVNSYLGFLAAAPIQWDEPMEWLENLKYLLRLTAPLTGNDRNQIAELRRKGKFPGMLPGPHAGELLSKMRASRNPLISTYAFREMVAPTPARIPAVPK